MLRVSDVDRRSFCLSADVENFERSILQRNQQPVKVRTNGFRLNLLRHQVERIG